MTDLPEDALQNPPEHSLPRADATPLASPPGENLAPLHCDAHPVAAAPPDPSSPSTSPIGAEQPIFSSCVQEPVHRPVRIPHFGHLMLLLLLLGAASVLMMLAIFAAVHFHLFGWQFSTLSSSDFRFDLFSEALLYLVTFGFCLFVFPMVWNQGYFQGLEWRAAAAKSKFPLLAGTAAVCFGLALVDQYLMPGPANAPIEKMISSPGAAWLMFAFGTTMAPFFEEMFFRGFLLPALCTACDWSAERMKGTLARPLDGDGHPQWSMPAMVIGSMLTSICFALLHVAQQGHSLGPFLLLIVVSLVLCAVRLKTRSLAASTLVHASYNFLLFSVMLIGTEGFRHLDKM